MKTIIILFAIFAINTVSQTYRTTFATSIRLSSDPSSGYDYLIVAPNNLNNSFTFSLPASVGNTGEILMSLGNGSYTWVDPTTSSSSPGGANTNIQFSDNGEFAGSNNLTWNNTNNRMTIGGVSSNFNLNINGWLGSGYDGQSGQLNLHTGNAGNYIFRFSPNSAMTESATLTLPANDGTAGQFLVTDGQGNLSWTSAAVGGNFDCIGQGTGGGSGNTATADDSFVGGGTGNSVNSNSDGGVIGGGSSNEITGSSNNSAIAVGTLNQISGSSDHSAIGAGSNNTIDENDYSAIGAGRYNTIGDEGDYSIIGSGEYNYIGSQYCAIVAGYSNTISENAIENIIGAGQNNYINYGQQNGIWSGYNNIIEGPNAPVSPYPNYSSIAGGSDNKITEDYIFIGGGRYNQVTEDYSSIGGGYDNAVNAQFSAVLGGYSNTVSGEYSMAFGYQAEATEDYTLAIGRRAVADNQGAFVFADNTDAELNSSANNRMEMRFSGGYRIFTNTAQTTGVTLAAGDNSWSSVSDMNVKSNILNLDYSNIFKKISELKISTWSYKDVDNKNLRNYGPMAQDFFKLFGKDELGHFGSDKEIISNHITNVGFAALKGLIEENERTNLKLDELKSEQTEILQELLILEQELIELENKLGEKK